MTKVFNGNHTKNSPVAFPGVILKSYIHPMPEYNDGYDTLKYDSPEVDFSFGLFTIKPRAQWPATKFDIAEVSYCLEGEGVFICDGAEYLVKPGFVIYIPKGVTRIIKNISDVELKYLCIVRPAWKPEYETVL